MNVFAAVGQREGGGLNREGEECLAAVLYRHSKIRIAQVAKSWGGQEEVKSQKPQTVEPPTPHIWRNISLSQLLVFLVSYISRITFFLILTRRSGPNGVFVQARYPPEDNGAVQKANQCIHGAHVRIMSFFKGISQLNSPIRDQMTGSSINPAVVNVFDELVDFVAAVSAGEVHESPNFSLPTIVCTTPSSSSRMNQHSSASVQALEGRRLEGCEEADGALFGGAVHQDQGVHRGMDNLRCMINVEGDAAEGVRLCEEGIQ